MTPAAPAEAGGREALRVAWRRVTHRMLAGLALALLLSAAAGWVWLGEHWFTGPTSTGAWVAGTVLAGLALVAAASTLVFVLRSPEPALRQHFRPGQLGLARFAAAWLAVVALAPALIALTIVWDR